MRNTDADDMVGAEQVRTPEQVSQAIAWIDVDVGARRDPPDPFIGVGNGFTWMPDDEEEPRAPQEPDAYQQAQSRREAQLAADVVARDTALQEWAQSKYREHRERLDQAASQAPAAPTSRAYTGSDAWVA